MTDQPQVDLARVVATLLEQQTAMLQQQTALLQAYVESDRFQRSVIERLLGGGPAIDVTVPVLQPEPATASTAPLTTAPPLAQVPTTPAPQEAPMDPVQHVESGSGPTVEAPTTPRVTRASSGSPIVDDETGRGINIGTGDEANAAYTARYYRAPPSATFTPVQPQDLELLRRLREIPEASGLILQFGPHKGENLGQVAVRNPEYIRQLVIRAQRPEVRAAAARLIEAIDAAAEHKRRMSRSSSRRSRVSA
jgi:hypothetical protein